MIKKIYSLLCIISLIIALPAFGMQRVPRPTYPCDLCQQEEKNDIKYIHLKTTTRECDHILCETCYHHDIKYLGLYFNSDRSDFDKYGVVGNCIICSRMLEKHNKQCWKDAPVKGSDTFVRNGDFQGPDFFITNPPNRVVPPVTPKKDVTNNPPTNKIKLLGIAGIGAIVCYGVYKIYAWYTKQEPQEKNTDTDEECLNQEESAKIAKQ
jgi:hypothetical protein